jgi:hypothetical protein
MSQIIVETLVEKVNNQEIRLNEQYKASTKIAETISTMKSESANIQKLSGVVNHLQDNLTRINWPLEEMRGLKSTLSQNNLLLQQPRKEKVIHVHTGSKLLWITIAVSVICILVIFGWIDTSNTLDNYKMNNACWRYLKLNMNAKDLDYLQKIERLYQQDPEQWIRLIEEKELAVQQRVEAQLKAEAAQKEADEWKKAARNENQERKNTKKRTTSKAKNQDK